MEPQRLQGRWDPGSYVQPEFIRAEYGRNLERDFLVTELLDHEEARVGPGAASRVLALKTGQRRHRPVFLWKAKTIADAVKTRPTTDAQESRRLLCGKRRTSQLRSVCWRHVETPLIHIPTFPLCAASP